MNESDVHMTRLLGWVITVLGRSAVLGAIVFGVFALVGYSSDSTGWIVAGVAVGLAVFGAGLYVSSPPLPATYDD